MAGRELLQDIIFTVLLCTNAIFAAVPITEGLLFHVSAERLSGYSNELPVSLWTDISGNNNHAFQNIADYRPIYITDALNGKPVLRFDGTNDSLSFPELPQVQTVFVVLRENPAATANWRPFIAHSATPPRWHRGANKTFWATQWGAAEVYNGQTKVNGVVVNGLTTTIPTHYSVVSHINTAPVPANQIGRDRAYVDRVWHGEIAEVLLYNRALSEQEENEVGWYLADQYALSTGYSYPGFSPFYPANKAVGIAPSTVNLIWRPFPNADRYKVFAGPSLPLPLVGMVTEPVFDMLPIAQPQTTYFWRIEAFNGETLLMQGEYWSFRTQGAWQDCPPADITGDCAVGMEDFLVLASYWLDPDPELFAVNFDGENGVDMKDFSILAEHWQQTPAGAVLISEFMARNDSKTPLRTQDLLDEDGEASDWIELYNTTHKPIALKDWHLTDNADNLSKWGFPDVTIPADDFLIIFASGKNRQETGAPLHTNFSLSGEGEYLALVRPDGQTVVHTYGVYPPQYNNISYGTSEAEAASIRTVKLLASNAPAKAIIPANDEFGQSWRELSFNDQGWLTGTTGVGYEASPGDTLNYTELLGLNVSGMRNVNPTVYVRVPFIADEPENITQLRLLMRYDDGFVAWLNGVEIARANAPQNLGFNTPATQQNLDVDAVIPEDFDCSLYIPQLRKGANVLAIQGMNSSLNSSDLLMLPELDASVIAEPSEIMLVGYFTVPTPGRRNPSANLAVGPTLYPITDNPPRPASDQEVTVAVRVQENIDPVAAVTLHYRVMFGPENQLTMRDDGVWPDEQSQDSIFSASIPAGVAGPGRMIRWAITAEDTAGRSSRIPLFPDPTDSPQYYGTVVNDPAAASQLPVFEWFVQDIAASETLAGARGALYYNSRFYDNIDIHIRGGSTAGMTKKHFKFKFNRGYKFIYDPNLPSVNEFNLNSTYSDKSYIRQPLAFEVYDLCGNPGPVSFPVRSQRNGEFFGISVFIEEPEEELLEREGLDPNGALYKMYNEFIPGLSAEKKTRQWEGRGDLDAFCTQINTLTGSALHNYIFDNVDIPRTLNYLVATVLTHQNDHPHKNHFLYRDSDGSGEWFFMPWDHDLTFGSNWVGDSGGSFSDLIYAANDQVTGRDISVKPSHPFIGKNDAKEWNNHWNRLTDKLLNNEQFRQMYLRRLRSMMDSLLQPPGTPYDQRRLEHRIDEMIAVMQPELAMDYAKWANPWTWGGQGGYQRDQSPEMAVNILKNDYLNVRRTHLFITHNVDNAASYPIANSYSALIPNAQPSEPAITLGAIDFNPVSFNQDEEYIQLINNNAYAVDISGWEIKNAVRYTFRPGTVIPGHNVLYASPNVAAFRGRSSDPRGGQGLLVQGKYQGHLSSWGETIELYDAGGRLADSKTYEGDPSDAQRYLRITELMYNPSVLDVSDYPTQDYEFIEFTNIGTEPLPLAGVKFTRGIDFAFPLEAVAAPGEYFILSKNPAAFCARYGILPDVQVYGGYEGQLSNGGETLKLEDHTHSTILEFAYVDSWYPLTDGLGYSLVFCGDLNGSYKLWEDKTGWKAGTLSDGTPGMVEPKLRLMHYWSFNDNTLLPVYSIGSAEMTIIPGPATEIIFGTGQDFAGLNNRLDEPTGTHLRVNNPLGSAMILRLSTTGYEDVVLKYETRRSAQGAGIQKIACSIDGVTFEPFAAISVFNNIPLTHAFDFSGIDGADNNPYFAVRIEFEQGDGGAAGNNRFDNMTLDGVLREGTH